MAKVKVINNNLDQNLNGTNFNDTPSRTIFSFGKFFVTSNFDGKANIDYTNTLSTFVRPVTLETMGVSDVQSQILRTYSTNAVLNLDKSDLNTFVRYGSAYEFLRVTIQNIILAYPGSLFANSQKKQGGVNTFAMFSYDEVTNVSTFYVKLESTVNTFGLVLNKDNTSIPDNVELKNLNISYDKYVVSTSLEPDTSYPLIGYTGNTVNNTGYYDGTGLELNKYIKVLVTGNPFSQYITGITATTGSLDFHIKPNNLVFEEFRALLNPYERFIVSDRNGTNGFRFILKDPTLLDDGTITYSNTALLWATADKYNIDIDTPDYQKLLKIVLTIGAKYDKVKTDLIARFLTPASLKIYDYTEEGKITKLLRIYGREFDQIREFIDSLVYINKVTYDKLNNTPDQLIKNLSRTFGWDYFSLVNESELVESFLTIDGNERNLNEDILPAEIDVELWRRIINNTSYFWKSKGTRQAIKSMFLLIGIPEPFINITEYVYTVDGIINPNTITLSEIDFPNTSLPYDTEGYPIAPLESPSFYFQISGDTDSGQAYMNNFRKAGFNLSQTIDNKKSWIQTGSTTRIHYSTPQYYQEDSKLVINTKEVDIALDTAQGIEYDVYKYIQEDFKINSSGYTLSYSYVNISLNVSASQTTFNLPAQFNKAEGDIEVRFNGILLNAPKTGTTTGVTNQADYSVDYGANTFTLLTGTAINSGNRKDVIQATYIYSGETTQPISGISVQYVVTRVKPNITGTIIPLPSYPRGDVQVTINGIALTKGTPQFSADYILDPANSSGSTTNQIIISNPEVISFLVDNPEVQIAYVEVDGSNDINVRSEIVRVDSFNTSKIYFNLSANKYVYKLNYKANSASDVKFLIDGVALEPFKDYNVNVMNPYEIFLPKGIRYGTVISAYYLVGGNTAFAPVVGDSFGLGDISKLSFLEFLDLVQRKMVNARNRKTISDFKGGWYPTVLQIYEKYLQRANLSQNDPLHSNGYTFENLYPFLSKYNAFFQRFVDQLLSSTIILKQGGLLVRNTVFTKQKFTYKRGVNLYAKGLTIVDMRGKPMLQYLGNDGSVFLIQQYFLPTIPTVNMIRVINVTQTTALLVGELTSDGNSPLIESGFIWSTHPNTTLENYLHSYSLGSGRISNFQYNVTSLLPNTTYYFRAYSVNGVGGAISVDEIQITTPMVVTTTPTVHMYSFGGVTQNSATLTGGVTYDGGAAVTEYGFVISKDNNNPNFGDLTITVLGSDIFDFSDIVTGLDANTTYFVKAFATNSNGTTFGGDTTNNNALVLVTLANVSPPVLKILSASATSNRTATATGRISNGGGAEVTEYGFLTSYYEYPTIDDVDGVTTIKTMIGSSTNLSPFIGEISGLIPNHEYYVRAYAINVHGTSYGDNDDGESIEILTFNIYDTQPTVVIHEVTDKTETSVVARGEVTSDGNLYVSEYGFVLGSNPNPTISEGNIKWDVDDPDNYPQFTSTITGLEIGANYYIKAYAINAEGTAYGGIPISDTAINFSTLQPEVPIAPTVETLPVQNTEDTTTVAFGEITADGGDVILEYGIIVYQGLDIVGTYYDNPTTPITTFHFDVTGLSPNTEYKIVAYASNDYDIGYGGEYTFTTEEAGEDPVGHIPIVEMIRADEITVNGVKFTGKIIDSGSGFGFYEEGQINLVGFVRSWDEYNPNPVLGDTTYYVNVDDIDADGSFTFTVTTDLYPNSTYYVNAFAQNSYVGTGYGTPIPFKTNAEDVVVPPLSVRTDTPTNVDYNRATFNGGIDSAGSASIIEYGFVYGYYVNPTIDNTKIFVSAGYAPTFTRNVALASQATSQQYSVRAYAKDSNDNIVYGGNVFFTTLPKPQAAVPVVINLNIIETTSNSVYLSGKVISDGGAPLKEYGFVSALSTVRFPYVDTHTTTIIGTTTDVIEFYGTISGLSPNTEYNVRAYAKNYKGIGYPQSTYPNYVLKFTTKP